MQNWKVTPAEVFAASPLVPVMVINDLEQALPMAKALLDGGISVFEITLRTPVALDAIALIAKAMPDAMVGAGTVLNCAQFDAAVAAGARFVISPGMTPALLAHAAKSTAPLIPGVATPSEVMQALEERLEDIRTPMDVSVIGCKVNGPGEAKEADIGIVGASPRSLVYRNGEKSHLIDTNQLVDEIETMVRQRVQELEEAKSKEIIRSSS